MLKNKIHKAIKYITSEELRTKILITRGINLESEDIIVNLKSKYYPNNMLFELQILEKKYMILHINNNKEEICMYEIIGEDSISLSYYKEIDTIRYNAEDEILSAVKCWLAIVKI